MFDNVSLKWKVLMLAVAGPIIVALVLAAQQAMQLRQSGEEDIVHQSRAVILMAEAARGEMSKKLDMGIIKPFDQLETREKLLEAIPIITAINMAQRNAEELGYSLKVPKVSPRNPENEPTTFELEVLKEMKAAKLKEKVVIEDDRIPFI